MDFSYIGTEDYMGLAPFWAWEYKYPVRDFDAALRVQVHDALIDAGLSLDGASDGHEKIIGPFVPSDEVATWEQSKARRRNGAQA